MKRLFFIALILIPFVLSAQNKKDRFVISPRLSFADFSNRDQWGGYSINKIPPIALQAERYINEYFTYGVLLGFYRDKYTNDTLSSNFHRDFNIGFGGLASFHYGKWLEHITHNKVRFNDFDLYLTLGLNWVVTNSTIRENYHLQNDMPEKLDETTVDFNFGPIAGVRYYITDAFAMNLEIGTGNLGLVTMGISWDFERDKKPKKQYTPDKLVPGDVN